MGAAGRQELEAKESLTAELAALIDLPVGVDGVDIQIVTRCGSAEEFIERFAPFTTETDIVVPGSPDAREGCAGPFVICLEDESVMMKGRCEVTEVRPASGPPETPLMRLRFREMDAHSAGIHLRLMEWRAFSPDPQTAPVPEVASSRAVPAEVPVDQSAVTVVRDTAPPADPETTEVSPLPVRETRGMSGDAVAGGAPAAERSERIAAADAGARSTARLDRARRIGRRAAPYATGLIVGLFLGLAIRSGSKPTPVVAVAPDLARPPVTAPPQVAAPPPAQVAAPQPSPAQEPSDDPIPESRHAVIDHRSGRPLARVIVTSSPARAFIKVNRHRIGRAPREISARQFERVRIEASLPGYRRWKKTIYLEEAEVKLDVTLVPTREAHAHRVAPRPAPPTRDAPPASAAVPAAVAAR